MKLSVTSPVSLQVKKSGKDPKVGAELTLRELSRKTTVRHQTYTNTVFKVPLSDKTDSASDISSIGV